jgi:pyruvate formate lyase activating enzyme
MLEIAKMARPLGIKNTCHTNGFLNEEPLRELCKFLDAICVDLKGFDENFYSDNCSGSLEPVLKNIKIIKQERVHLELVNLVIPGMNDNSATVEKMCRWISENLGQDVPLHFLAFYPRHKLNNLNSTPLKTLEKLKQKAESVGLHYCFISNIPAHSAKSTYCPRCKNLLIERVNREIAKNKIVHEKCSYCGFKITGYWA